MCFVQICVATVTMRGGKEREGGGNVKKEVTRKGGNEKKEGKWRAPNNLPFVSVTLGPSTKHFAVLFH